MNQSKVLVLIIYLSYHGTQHGNCMLARFIGIQNERLCAHALASPSCGVGRGGLDISCLLCLLCKVASAVNGRVCHRHAIYNRGCLRFDALLVGCCHHAKGAGLRSCAHAPMPSPCTSCAHAQGQVPGPAPVARLQPFVREQEPLPAWRGPPPQVDMTRVSFRSTSI